jgi:hypothetical protein
LGLTTGELVKQPGDLGEALRVLGPECNDHDDHASCEVGN